MNPDLSIVIVTIRDDIRPLKHFKRSDFDDYEVIISRTPGIARARNEGVEDASSDKILFIDDDAKPCHSYLSTASRLLDQHPAITGRVVQPPNTPFSDLDMESYGQDSDPNEVPFLIGCNMGFQRQVLDSVGGFDERFDFGHEESELAERICEESYIRYSPELCVEHSYAASRRRFWWKQFREGKSDVKFLDKKGVDRRDQSKTFISHIYRVERTPTQFVGCLCRTAGRISEML